MAVLFHRIYDQNQKCILDSWKMSEIVPIHKKGNKNQVENCQPVANLCSVSKFFEKLILKHLQFLESKNNLGLTGK
jgi:hypothetical protein